MTAHVSESSNPPFPEPPWITATREVAAEAARGLEGVIMNLLSKEAILQADDRRYEIVNVPEWKGEVRLRSLSGAERDQYEAGLTRQVGNTQKIDARNARAKLVALSACDENGQPVFDPKDVIGLGNKSSAALQRLFDAAMRLSGFTEDDMKELEEGFGDAPNGASTSDSQPTSATPSPNSWHGSTHGN